MTLKFQKKCIMISVMKKLYFLVAVLVSVWIFTSCNMSGSDDAANDSDDEVAEETTLDDVNSTLEDLEDIIDRLLNDPDMYMVQFKDGVFPTNSYSQCTDACIANGHYPPAGTNILGGAGFEHGVEIANLIKFDIAGCIPSNAVVKRAILTSCIEDFSSDIPLPVTFHEITVPWDEEYAIWEASDNGMSWDGTGGDVNSAFDAGAIVGSATITADKKVFDISLNTAMVSKWVTNFTENHGIIMRSGPVIEDVAKFYFYSSDTVEEKDTNRHPMLTVFYTYP